MFMEVINNFWASMGITKNYATTREAIKNILHYSSRSVELVFTLSALFFSCIQGLSYITRMSVGVGGQGGCSSLLLGRNPFHSVKFPERTMGNSGRRFTAHQN